MSESDALLAYCGLYCGNCLYFQNTSKGISTDRGDGTYEDCVGCNTDRATLWCTECGIKKCNRQKGIRFCLECGDYPCEMMTGFMDDPKYPYHKEVPDNMKRLLETDPNTWAQEMDKKYTCGECGKKFTYFDACCPKCK